MNNYRELVIVSTVFLSLSVLTACDPVASDAPLTNITSEDVHASDGDVTDRVQTALLNDTQLNNFKITVVTHKGDVLLTGQVDNQNQLNYAEKLVLGIEGAHTVHNHLTIKDANS